MNSSVTHPFRALTLAVFFGSSVGQSVLAQVNDDFVDRIVLGSILPVSATGSNVRATSELDEPAHAESAAGSSVWWEWTAPSSGTVQIDTFGSDFDTELAVYTGTARSTLTDIASNDDMGGRLSRLCFSAVKGTTYQIAVDGFSVSKGDIALTICMAPPERPNDNLRRASHYVKYRHLQTEAMSGLPVSSLNLTQTSTQGHGHFP